MRHCGPHVVQRSMSAGVCFMNVVVGMWTVPAFSHLPETSTSKQGRIDAICSHRQSDRSEAGSCGTTGTRDARVLKKEDRETECLQNTRHPVGQGSCARVPCAATPGRAACILAPLDGHAGCGGATRVGLLAPGVAIGGSRRMRRHGTTPR